MNDTGPHGQESLGSRESLESGTSNGFLSREALTYTASYCEENIYLILRDHVKKEHLSNYTVVYISNKQKFVPLFYQKLALNEGIPVCWDYHVILLYRHASIPSETTSSKHHPTEPTQTHHVYVYDFDTLLTPFPLPFSTYFTKTLFGPSLSGYPPEFTRDIPILLSTSPRNFKLIPGENYLRLFSSSRVHMLKATNGVHNINVPPESTTTSTVPAIEEISQMSEDMFIAKPPSYPAIGTEASENTLPLFLDFSQDWVDGDYGRVLNQESFLQEFSFSRQDLTFST